MKVITEEAKEKMHELLHDEIVKDVKDGDTTVLFEIIKNLSTTNSFYSLSDEGQKQIKFI